MTSFQSPLAKHLNKGGSSDSGKHDQLAPTRTLPASGETKRTAHAATPSLLLRSKLSPQPAMFSTLKHPQASQRGSAARGVSPIPPTTTLDDQLNQGDADASKAGPGLGPKQPPEPVSTPRRQLAQPLLVTPGRPTAPAAQFLSVRAGGTPGAAQQQQALGQAAAAPAPQWTPLVASPALGPVKAQGAGLLSVRRGPAQPAHMALQPTSAHLSQAPTPGLGPGTLGPPSAGNASEAAVPVLPTQQQHGQQEQQWGRPGALFTPPPLPLPLGAGSMAARPTAAIEGAEGGGAGLGAPGGGGLGSESSGQREHLVGARLSRLSVRLQAAEDPAVLRRELRSLVPDLPVGQYVAPAPPLGTAQALQRQEPGAEGGGAAAKPAFLETGAAAGAALDRLRELRGEGERLVEEGGAMDRAFIGRARPLLAAATAASEQATPGGAPAPATWNGEQRREALAPSSAAPAAAASGVGRRPEQRSEEGGRGGPAESALQRLAQLRGLQQEGLQLAAQLGG